ncbi:MAG TPA: protein-L-isoaspartate O-methyltransferase [Verrucomicrobia bacterium]|nr:MAG: protein-L-isoaspartate O-methyltransferase [Lentisphaerae bacterium GWF2_57_35]HBA84573.1 protein-L-isoaspartate O-methyltransferase [Verrucomicrobiota bacterium]
MNDFSLMREHMLEVDLKARGIRNPEVLGAMRAVPREAFVPAALYDEAYADHPLPIGKGQTISQPYMVALMTELADARASSKVLEVGSGCGYQAAVLAEICRMVYTVEILPELAEQARENLKALGYRNVKVRTGDGAKGWPEQAPFDAVLVAAAPVTVPLALVDQLKLGGRLVIPVGAAMSSQYLMLIRKHEDGTVSEEKIIPVRFVPLTGPETNEKSPTEGEEQI